MRTGNAGTRRTVVGLMLGTIITASVLFAASTIWHTQNLNDSYNDALKAELEHKMLTTLVTGEAFVDILGPSALEAISFLIDESNQGSDDVSDGPRFNNEVLRFELWAPDAAAPDGFSLVVAEEFNEGEALSGSDEGIKELVDDTWETGEPSVAIDDSTQAMYGTVVLPLEDGSEVVALAALSANDEFAFFAQQRSESFRSGILLSIAIAGAVSLTGGGLSLYVAKNLTNRHRAEQAQARLVAMLEGTSDFAGIADSDRRIVYVNEAGKRMIGLAPHEDISSVRISEYHPDWTNTLLEREAIPTAIREGRWTGEAAFLSREGREIPVSMVLLSHKSPTGDVQYYSTISRDISERKQFEAQLEDAANHDSLTRLFSRRRMEDEMERELARTRRQGTNGALLFLDVDQFKDVNDSLGHQAGDELLIELADLLRQSLRSTDTLSRFGGDEFAVLFPDTDPEQAVEVSTKLIQAIQDHAFIVRGERVSVSASGGVAVFPETDDTPADILARADMAMYRAKQEGRNCIRVSEEGAFWRAESRLRLNWHTRLHEALENDRFVLHAQPILDLSTNRVAQHELLLRMIESDGTLVPPESFMSVAEQAGMIQAIERWVIRRAIQLIAEHRSDGREPRLSVNLSGKGFADPELPVIIRSELEANGVDPSSLLMEVTETAAIRNIHQAQDFIRDLKKLGCRFALDDFGIGISSFYFLKHLPVDYLKIDGAFITDLPDSPKDQHLVEAMVVAGRGLGIKTVAEFVETEEALEWVRKLGVDYAQGYAIGRPAPVSEYILTGDRASEQAA